MNDAPNRHLPFGKPATSFDDQVSRLRARGLVIQDEGAVRHWLRTVGYYRLGVYWLPFEAPAPEGTTRSKTFRPGTTFEDVTDLYIFDRTLRLLVMEAIERCEIALRAGWTYQMANRHGPHAHLDPELFTWGLGYAQALANLEDRIRASSEVFVKHYLRKYDPPTLPPLWMTTELMTLGELSRWVEHTRDNDAVDTVAKDLGLPNRDVLKGVFSALSYTRNLCAHHGRLWNRQHVKRLPFIRKFKADLVRDPQSHSKIDNSTCNITVVLCRMLAHQSPDTSYPDRMEALLASRPEWQRRAMGYLD